VTESLERTMNEPLTCPPCLIIVLHDVTDNPEVASTSFVLVYPTDVIEIFEDGTLTTFCMKDTQVPA